jgi:hypothetical protein
MPCLRGERPLSLWRCRLVYILGVLALHCILRLVLELPSGMLCSSLMLVDDFDQDRTKLGRGPVAHSVVQLVLSRRVQQIDNN